MRPHLLRHFQQTVDAAVRDASDAAPVAPSRSSTLDSALRKRAPENELYDRACDVLLAARDLRRAATRDGTSRALAATLGCVEETLSVLAEAADELGMTAVVNLNSDAMGSGDTSALAARPFGELRDALMSSRSACRAAREAAGPGFAPR
jgi:hypothetical protein